MIDDKLNFLDHITKTAQSYRFALYNIRKIRPFLSEHASQLLIQALVLSRLDYCNTLLAGLPASSIKPLQLIQNAAAALIFNEPKITHVTPLFINLHWLPIAAHIKFKAIMFAFKTTSGSAPLYLKHGSSCLVSTVQTAAGGIMVWGVFSWHTLGPLVPIEHHLNTTVYLSIVAEHVHLFMTTVYHLLMYFQQDNAPCHKDQIISDWFLEHDNEFTLLKWTPQSPDLNPIEHLWDVVEREILIMDVQTTVQTTNLQQLRDAIMTIWTKISEERFQHLVESMPQRIKAVLKTKGVQPGTSKVYLIKHLIVCC